MAVNPKWQGQLHVVVAAPLERVWLIASDCCGLPKWMPMVESCELLEGEEGKPGLVRFLSGEMFPRLQGEQSWIKEKLLAMDPLSHQYTYSMVDGNIGITGYVNNVQFFDFGDGTTLVHWLFEVDPVPSGTKEATIEYLVFLYKSSLKRLASCVIEDQAADAEESIEVELMMQGERQ